MKPIKLIRNLLGWIFIIIGILGSSTYPISGLVFIFWGLLILPFANKFLASRGFRLNVWKRLGIAFVGLCLFVIFTPSDSQTQPQETVIKPAPELVPSTTIATIEDSKLASSSASSNVTQPTQPKPENRPNPPKEIAEKDFKTFLPPENRELKSFILSDPFLSGYFSADSIWIGNAIKSDLINRGFYVNTLYKHTGGGEGSEIDAKGACSPIGFDAAFMCGRGLTPYQWGIQNDKAILKLNELEEEWASYR